MLHSLLLTLDLFKQMLHLIQVMLLTYHKMLLDNMLTLRLHKPMPHINHRMLQVSTLTQHLHRLMLRIKVKMQLDNMLTLRLYKQTQHIKVKMQLDSTQILLSIMLIQGLLKQTAHTFMLTLLIHMQIH